LILRTWRVLLNLQCIIEKENNFKQAGERFRSFDPARFAPTPQAVWFTGIERH
jgi:hypothetical protein